MSFIDFSTLSDADLIVKRRRFLRKLGLKAQPESMRRGWRSTIRMIDLELAERGIDYRKAQEQIREAAERTRINPEAW